MGGISTHVLDTARGRPAGGIAVVLEQRDIRGEWRTIGQGDTDAEGRLGAFVPEGVSLEPGQYRLIFDTRTYFGAQSVRTFYPTVVVVFETMAGEPHYHVPLLLGPFGYTTYRGS